MIFSDVHPENTSAKILFIVGVTLPSPATVTECVFVDVLQTLGDELASPEINNN